MLRLMGGALLTAAGTALGLGQALTAARRTGAILAWSQALRQGAGILAGRSEETGDLLRELGKSTRGEAGAFFTACAGAMDRLGDTAFSDLWDECLEGQCRLLGGEERRLLRGLGHILGQTDRQGQCAALMNTADQLQRLWQEARAAQAGRGRLYTLLGGCAGLLTTILLL